MREILTQLNKEQLEAVTHLEGPLLVIAGAGSGKTKTITTRVAYLISLGIEPSSILTLTFTNKAAREMRERALGLLEESSLNSYPLLCTFHKFGLIFLRRYMGYLNRSNAFVIIDNDDKKRILRSFESKLPVPLISSEISKYKNSQISPKEAIESARLENFKEIAEIYEEYENYLVKNNLVDFDDLLLLTYKILDQNQEICDHISQLYSFIMVDEFQDTNELQSLLLKKLCSTHNNLCVVGDDDQSIYSWRGATVRNILEFPYEFAGAKVVKLEKNYRSTKKILEAANTLISHNRNRVSKKLQPTKEEGKAVEVVSLKNEQEEAQLVAKRIKALLEEGVNPSQIAVLFRINALSRSLEEAFKKAKIHYKVVGSTPFYERAEIKDAICYFRVLTNPSDEFSFKRIINKPRRGIGKATYEKLKAAASVKNLSILEMLWELDLEEIKEIVGKRSAKTLYSFVSDLKYLHNILKFNSGASFLKEFEEYIGLKKFYSLMPDGEDRVANLEELEGLFKEFIKTSPFGSLEEFLAEISLESEQDQIQESAISIMSVHASKGLEFDHLFVIGLEEGLFPLTGEESDIEEERRLGYVAITRAKKELTLTYARSRFYKGRRVRLERSRFLNEAGLMRGSVKIERRKGYKKGDLVRHKLFGIGRVIGVSGARKEVKLTINFGGKIYHILSSFVEKL